MTWFGADKTIQWLEVTNDYETLKSKIDQLEQAAAMMSQYAAQQNNAAPNAGATASENTTTNEAKPDDVVDVDYSEK